MCRHRSANPTAKVQSHETKEVGGGGSPILFCRLKIIVPPMAYGKTSLAPLRSVQFSSVPFRSVHALPTTPHARCQWCGVCESVRNHDSAAIVDQAT